MNSLTQPQNVTIAIMKFMIRSGRYGSALVMALEARSAKTTILFRGFGFVFRIDTSYRGISVLFGKLNVNDGVPRSCSPAESETR